jgi:NADH-quinone oxidoreductase subunit A
VSADFPEMAPFASGVENSTAVFFNVPPHVASDDGLRLTAAVYALDVNGQAPRVVTATAVAYSFLARCYCSAASCYNSPPDCGPFIHPMLQNYLPILIFLGVACAVGIALLVLGFLLSPHKPDAEKLSPYECGFEPFEDSRIKFDVRYYLVAILFIVFDLEIAFLFPWAVSLNSIGAVGIGAMGVFLLILIVGFVYEWKKGALEWD